MATIKQERMQILADAERLKSNYDKDEERRRAEFRRNLSVADRLMRRVEVTRFKTVFEDDLGDIVVASRQMTSQERFRAVELNKLLARSDEEPDLYDEAVKGFKELAAEITVTPGMAAYYESPGCVDDVPIAVVTNTLYKSMRLVGEALTSFRSQ